MFSKKKSRLNKNLKNLLILVLLGLLVISVWFNYILYENVKNSNIIIQSLEDDQNTMYKSIAESMNKLCNNLKDRNSTIMSLVSVLSISRVYMNSQFKLLYLFCDIEKNVKNCEKSSKKFDLGYNLFFSIAQIMKKYVNNEITQEEFSSIICNLTKYFEKEDINAIKKLRENI
jgi:hypothetical protein